MTAIRSQFVGYQNPRIAVAKSYQTLSGALVPEGQWGADRPKNPYIIP